jgi:hypothetical protein
LIQGLPAKPLTPPLMDITAISIKINWTAGFNFGLEQRFTVFCRNENSGIEYFTKVNTKPDVNKGEVDVYQLNNYATIQSNVALPTQYEYNLRTIMREVQ